jgi:hypothetical protein
MKLVILKAIIAIVSVLLAGSLWMGLIVLLKKSGIDILQSLAVYISQLSFIGWLLFGVGSIILYLVFSKVVISRVGV